MSMRTYAGDVLVEEWDDDARWYRRWSLDGTLELDMSYVDKSVADGFPGGHYDEEADGAVQESAYASLEQRVARIEATLWPGGEEPPTDPANVSTFEEMGGVWPAGTLLLDSGTVWRNVSGVPLTTPPSGFPGSPGQWTHLFVVEETGPDEWAVGVAYVVDDTVTYGGGVYDCLQAHTSQATWIPPDSPSLWAVASV